MAHRDDPKFQPRDTVRAGRFVSREAGKTGSLELQEGVRQRQTQRVKDFP